VLAGEPTGAPRATIAQVACRAKRDLRSGEVIDGEGGEHVFGALRATVAGGDDDVLPMGLARGARLRRDVARGAEVTRTDVELPATGAAGKLHAELAQELRSARSTDLS
jgi:predicted homoserine dehydrogenase-like protein